MPRAAMLDARPYARFMPYDSVAPPPQMQAWPALPSTPLADTIFRPFRHFDSA